MSDFNHDLRHAFLPLRWLLLLLALVAVLLYLLSGLYSLETEQRGVVKQMGRIAYDNVPPGMHYHWPWPFEHVVRVRATAVRSLQLTFSPQSDSPLQDELLTRDENLLVVTLSLQYTVINPRGFLTAAVEPEAILSHIARAASIEHFARSSVDALLTTGRNALQNDLRQVIQQQTDALGLGLRIKSAQLKQLAPPEHAKTAFDAVARARTDKLKTVQGAHSERSTRLANARGKANRLIQQAKAYVRETIEKAKGDTQHFQSTWKVYRDARLATAYRLYLETLEQVLLKAKLVLVQAQKNQIIQSTTASQTPTWKTGQDASLPFAK